ncbi:RNA polymerase sigma factor [Leadbettera azotonutricia]|uniref:RNA polymerase, sigma-24 subunit, ECF subfamily n=1 Tax=Leadbettera azotonutricia (strain ATCC BAA-888 / DSM 13862 / ZAS-9) TaxID=545695 RepID=F5YAL8_LEAAZ|nr:sigma-70 family RNA polymerase sigma factor [Leadbettera azotonutricia]AEF82819.1 RNA polymerase, sigma-24 subunit, ECF subfamily [Leadbettera azotonutricia ZAS-9]
MPQNITAVFNTYRERLTNFIRKRVSSLEDTEDILQDVFYQFTRMDSIENPVEQTAAWLYRVARNRIINHQNKKHDAEMPVYYDDDSDDDDFVFQDIADVVFDTEVTPETEYLRSMIYDEVKTALAELPQEQREVFELSEYSDYSVKEIAEKTHTPINTVLSRKHYAVLHLRKRLKELYADIMGGG